MRSSRVLLALMFLLVIISLAIGKIMKLVGLGQAQSSRPMAGNSPNTQSPDLPVFQPVFVDQDSLARLLAIDERAAGLAGYPALVEAGHRQAVARQAAEAMAAMQAETNQIASPYAGQQGAILAALRYGLEAYAGGEGASAVATASEANAALRETLLGLLEGTDGQAVVPISGQD